MSPFPQQKAITPMMAQWHACKEKAGDALLLFRMGDFYEAFYEDAALLAKELELTLTKRAGVPMSGIPQHAAGGYIDRLVGKGHRVAIAEQTEEAKACKGLVNRQIVRIVTPGSLVASSLLKDNRCNYLASLNQVGATFGLALLEISTGECCVFETGDEKELFSEIYRLQPSELLLSEKFLGRWPKEMDEIKARHSTLIQTLPEWFFEHSSAYAMLVSHFQVHNLDGFGVKGMVAAINAAGALFHYVRDELLQPLGHIRQLCAYHLKQTLGLDRITLRNLEIVEPLQGEGKGHTLLSVIDNTCTPMGGRLMRKWLVQPLRCQTAIESRLSSIEEIFDHPTLLQALQTQLQKVRDLQRLIMKITSGVATPRDIKALESSLEPIAHIKRLIADGACPYLQSLHNAMNEEKVVLELIKQALVDEPCAKPTEGQIFKPGYHAELDVCYHLTHDGKSWLAQYQEELRQATGIKTLKVGFTQVFGYYIEVSKNQAAKMPPSFQRRQTLVNTERFISHALKEYEEKVFSAEEKIARLQLELFQDLRLKIAQYASSIQSTSLAIAELDCLHSLSQVARKWNWTRPEIDESDRIEILQGRHPVIESCYLGRAFTPNDTLLDDDQHRLLLLTGPNMAGKSTYIRQVALICILAHVGSFVPAAKAHIGMLDKIFTRIGASDDLARGQSTFMIEMIETGNIVHNATKQSLVILDEIGRGTSTYDGISIAWAVAEHLLTKDKRAKTLFATHFWELTQLEEKHKGAINYTTLIQEMKEEIVFLHKIVRGGTDKSYGIHVAKLAGLPPPLIKRAKQILKALEEQAARRLNKDESLPKEDKSACAEQMLLFNAAPSASKEEAEITDEIRQIDLHHLTPMQAYQKLIVWQEKLLCY